MPPVPPPIPSGLGGHSGPGSQSGTGKIAPATPGKIVKDRLPARVINPTAPVPVGFQAFVTQTGPVLKKGVTWRVYSFPDRKLLSVHSAALTTAHLAPGTYFVNAAYGLANLTRKIEVKPGAPDEESFVLNAGALQVLAKFMDDRPIKAGIRFTIQSDDQDQFGNRPTILSNVKPGRMVRLNAGGYHIISAYGDTNAKVEANVVVEPGKLTVATIKQSAAKVTFRLVQKPGGEALADTQWTILTASGEVVTKGAGALPTHILAAGEYTVIARHNGLSYIGKFTVQSDKPEQVEVAMENGPASPEALKEAADPSGEPADDSSETSAATPLPNADTAPMPHRASHGIAHPEALLRDSVH